MHQPPPPPKVESITTAISGTVCTVEMVQKLYKINQEKEEEKQKKAEEKQIKKEQVKVEKETKQKQREEKKIQREELKKEKTVRRGTKRAGVEPSNNIPTTDATSTPPATPAPETATDIPHHPTVADTPTKEPAFSCTAVELTPVKKTKV